VGDAGDAGAKDAGHGDAGSLDGGACAACQSPISCGTVQNPAITAVAGIAASALHAGAFYLHNGPPDPGRFFAVDETGADLGTYAVNGTANFGWEDVGVGRCPAGSCIFLADIGDPGATRGQYAVYRVTEPATLAAGEATVTADTFPFVYPDGSHDAAAILVHPLTGAVTVLTRDRSGAGTLVFELPAAQPGQVVTATPRGALEQLGPGVSVTAGSVHPTSLAVLLRTSAGALLFAAAPGDAGTQPIAAAFASVPCALGVATEVDGEAIAWMRSGAGYLALDQGAGATLSYGFCPAL
jgi:hypothetical protein